MTAESADREATGTEPKVGAMNATTDACQEAKPISSRSILIAIVYSYGSWNNKSEDIDVKPNHKRLEFKSYSTPRTDMCLLLLRCTNIATRTPYT